jgi:hypothetical protein
VAAGEGIKFAGLLVDSIFSSDGVFTDPPGFLKAAVDVTRTALRLGRSFFSPSFSLAAFLPWISTMARGFRFDGGHPVPEWSPSASVERQARERQALSWPFRARGTTILCGHLFGMHRFRSDIGNITLGQVTEPIQC